VLDAVSAGDGPIAGRICARMPARAVSAPRWGRSPGLRDEHDAAWSAARVPDAGVLWRRAQLRARAEAARIATRPIAAAQGVALACAAGLAVAFLGAGLAWITPWLHWLTASVSTLGAGALTVTADASFAGRAVALAFTIWIVLAPVAVHLVLADE
jgi:hypothetical protein